MKKILPSLAVITICGSFGILFAMGLGFGIFWKTLDPRAFMQAFSAEFPYFILPTVLMLIPALVSTIFLVAGNKNQKEIRQPSLYAMTGMLIAFTITTVYHLPVNLGFMASKYTAEEATSKLDLWLILHWVRTAAVFVSALYAIKALQLSNERLISISKNI